MSIICVFPGQGSQAPGMGAGLFDRFEDWTAEADAILGYSIRTLCVDDPRNELGLTAFTQPAMFVVNAMMYRARQEGGAAAPAFVAGHSLGEYNALHAAEVFDFGAGLRLVTRRGELMSRVRGGGMAAVIGLEPARIEAILGRTDAGRRLDIANFNSFDQTVIAGPKADLAAVQLEFEQAGARAFVMLNVSAPFHSRYMTETQAEFEAFLRGFTFSPPVVPVVANVTARPHEPLAIHQTLGRQISSSVRWLDSVRYLLGQPEPQFEEIGPGRVLTKLVAQIAKRPR
jgi:trans-AT polyketide synthase/acyltransferase/oxidoreductase domain-containing protein